MRKRGLIVAAMLCMALSGCGEEEMHVPAPDTYSAEEGTVVGTADFATETPNINISNLKGYKGEEIDYSSGVEVTNVDNIDDFQMWVDASRVDIYTTGTYDAVYKFIYNGKSIEKVIKVTIIENVVQAGDTVAEQKTEKEEETTAIVSGNTQGNQSSQNVQNGGHSQGNASGTVAPSITQTTASATTSKNNQQTVIQQTTTKKNNGTTQQTTTGKNNGTTQQTTTGKNNSTTQQSTTKNNTSETSTTRREIVTTTSNGKTTKPYSIGYMEIELLSGTSVTIKCTSSRYIVSTRTDLSQITKNGVKYKVYKLIITYNTGDEQVLETYEEKIK